MVCNFLTILIICVFYISVFAKLGQDDPDWVNISNIPRFQVKDLPKFNLYAGYLNITFETKAFHYFLFQSMHQPLDDPVILWLNGGPGCSSLMGMVTQNGPFRFYQGEDKMYFNQYAWNTKANVIYLESPAGVGFSVGKGDDLITNDTKTAADNLKALEKFFDRFPQLMDNPFYLTGQSYAGIYIPMLAEQILEYNDDVHDRRINLRGILLGNACTHPYECLTSVYYSRYTYQFLYTRGFLDKPDYDLYLEECAFSQSAQGCIKQQRQLKQTFINSKANIYNVYAKCFSNKIQQMGNSQLSKRLQTKLNNYNQQSLKHPLNCSDAFGSLVLFNDDKIREEFHVGLDSYDLPWTPCSDITKYKIDVGETYYILPNLIKAGLKLMYFSGDMDAIVPIQGTIYWIEKMKSDFGLTVKKPWRPWITEKPRQISGMVYQLQGITFVSFRGAGHMVPTDKPAEAYEMLTVFLEDREWKQPQGYIQQSNEQ